MDGCIDDFDILRFDYIIDHNKMDELMSMERFEKYVDQNKKTVVGT